MSQLATEPGRAPGSAPPHPFRAAPWYDPQVEHHPCRCPRCRGDGPPRLRLRPVRLAVALGGGVALPALSLLLNDKMRVVELGYLGELLVALAMLGAVANLALAPTRRDPVSKAVQRCPPRSTALRVALLLAALLGCVVWGYLSLLLLPLLPLSVLALVLAGIGLCGLSPFGALALAVVQTVRGVRAVAERLRTRWVVALVLTALLLPPLAIAAAGLHQHQRAARLELALDDIARTAPFSIERMQRIAALEGAEGRLVDAYLATQDRTRHAVIAEVYLRLRDRPLNAEVGERAQRRRQGLIRPWWFLEGGIHEAFSLREVMPFLRW